MLNPRSCNVALCYAGSVSLSSIFPVTFADVQLPVLASYLACEDYVSDYSTDLEEAIVEFLEAEINVAIFVTGCEFLYGDGSNTSAPSPPPSRKLLADVTTDDRKFIPHWFIDTQSMALSVISFALISSFIQVFASLYSCQLMMRRE